MNIKFKILPPSKELSSFIEYYKFIEGYLPGKFKLIPFINQEAYFHLNPDNYQLHSPGKYAITNPMIHFLGLQEYEQGVFSCINRDEPIRSLVIIFKPNGIQKLFRLSNSEIHANVISGEDLFKDYCDYLWNQIKECSGISEMKNKLEGFLLRLVKTEAKKDPLIQFMLEWIKIKNGLTTIRQLSREFNLSVRSLQRRFKDEVAMSPKEYLQITRINYAICLMNSNFEKSLAEVSYLSGYYDQSHFTRDIRKICGIVPVKIKNNAEKLEETANRFYLKLASQRNG